MSQRFDPLRLVAIVLLAIYWATMFGGTHVPQHVLPRLASNDKLLHFAAYTGHAFLLAWSVAAARPTRTRVVAVLALSVIYGVLDELSQSLIPTRSCELLDWVADCVGAMAGVGCYGASLAMVHTLLRRKGGRGRRTDGKGYMREAECRVSECAREGLQAETVVVSVSLCPEIDPG